MRASNAAAFGCDADVIRGWRVLSLDPDVEVLHLASFIRRYLEAIFPGARVLLPAERDGVIDPDHPLASLIFVESGTAARSFSPFPLVGQESDAAVRTLLKATSDTLTPGTRVRVERGPFRGVQGVADALDGEHVTVKLSLPSGDRRVTVNRSHVRVLE